ncbi:hypothetical protein, partial [uncultured Gammaproteobacteria bacterium]
MFNIFKKNKTNSAKTPASLKERLVKSRKKLGFG